MGSQPQNRRERPAKPALSRDSIVAATIAVLRGEGLEKVTMRRVAEVLDTGPASLYVYVANVAELHAAVLDELLKSLDMGSGCWRARLHTLLGEVSGVLYDHPGLARSALLLRPSGPHAMRLYDQILGLLLEGGCSVEPAAWGVDLLLQHVIADAAEHSAPTPGAINANTEPQDAWTGFTSALRSASASSAPHVVTHVDALLSGTPEQRTFWAIEALINGIATTTIPTPSELPT